MGDRPDGVLSDRRGPWVLNPDLIRVGEQCLSHAVLSNSTRISAKGIERVSKRPLLTLRNPVGKGGRAEKRQFTTVPKPALYGWAKV